MTPAEAATVVAEEIAVELAITEDHIERTVLHEVRKRFLAFAELLEDPS